MPNVPGAGISAGDAAAASSGLFGRASHDIARPPSELDKMRGVLELPSAEDASGLIAQITQMANRSPSWKLTHKIESCDHMAKRLFDLGVTSLTEFYSTDVFSGDANALWPAPVKGQEQGG